MEGFIDEEIPDSFPATLRVEMYFDAAHYLPNYKGKCANIHGHTYRVIVEISGITKNGMLVDFTILKKEIKSVIDQLDHTLLNAVIKYPSAENIAWYIKSQLVQSRELKECDLNDVVVTVYEGLNNSVRV